MGHVTECWKKGAVIFFSKRNRLSNNGYSYKPITLLLIMRMILERIIKIRIITMLESSSFIDSTQHGFPETKSTIAALKLLKVLISNTLKIYKYCAMISTDIGGTIGRLNWFVIVQVVDEIPVFDYFKSSIKNYISHRLISFRFVRSCRWFWLFRGCLLGSCLSQLIGTIISDRILKSYKRLSIISYAGDNIIMEGADMRALLEQIINNNFSTFVNNCESLHFLMFS